MNLYSNKQKWKIALLVVALLLVGLSLFVSNSIVKKVHIRETERATQWADAIKKKVELVQLTDNTFSQLRDKEREKMQLWIEATKEVSKPTNLDQNSDVTFPFLIINKNKNIPVILVDDQQQVSGFINLDFDTNTFRRLYPEANTQKINRLFEDSLLRLTTEWKKYNAPFTLEVFEDFFMTYYYSDSKEIKRLEEERDSLINSFNTDLINNDGLVPVLLVNAKNDTIIGSNLDSTLVGPLQLTQTKANLAAKNPPIRIQFGEDEELILYYDSSSELIQLQYFPFIQFFIIGLFIVIGYLIFSTFRKAEQNQVWAGMAKETAHQLGTPLSSLMAWIELLDNIPENAAYTVEMRKDIDRLDKVTDRFSKIGSEAKLISSDLVQTVVQVVGYLKVRVSKNVDLSVESKGEMIVPHNAPLMEWVVENIIKNAVDAMEAKGKIVVTLHADSQRAYIDIQDNGKGIPSNQIKSIFQPGFSTKKRGWGLGLSLVKRIVKEYHKGKVFVLHSELNVGTTFRISLPLK